MVTIIRHTCVECTFEPRGDIGGLEGFQFGEQYPAEFCKSTLHPKGYYRLYLSPSYYENASLHTFKRCFKEVINA